MDRIDVETTDHTKRHQETLWFSAYTGQMALLWQQFQYVQIVATATLVAWFIARSSDRLISLCVLMLGSLLQCVMIAILRRHAQILTEFTNRLTERTLIGQDESLKSPRSILALQSGCIDPAHEQNGGRAYTAHRLARITAFLMILVNGFLTFLTVVQGLLAPFATAACIAPVFADPLVAFFIAGLMSILLVVSGYAIVPVRSWVTFWLLEEKRSWSDKGLDL